MSAFASNNEHFTPQPFEEIHTIPVAREFSCFMAGFESVDEMVDESDRWLVSEADECQAMECVDPTAPPYDEAHATSLENCLWLEPKFAAGECQDMPGTDPDCKKRPESYTVGTRTGAGVRKVVLNLPVLQEKASRKLTLKQTAQEFRMSQTALKTSLRKLGIEDWRKFHKKS